MTIELKTDMVPTQKTSRHRTGGRRSHHALKKIGLSKCSKCSQPTLPHRVCLNCGYYKGKEVVNVLAKLEKKDRKIRQKEIAEQEKTQEKQAKSPKGLNAADLSQK